MHSSAFQVLNRFCLTDMREHVGLLHLSLKIATVKNMVIDMEKNACNDVFSSSNTNMSHINVGSVLEQNVKIIHIGFYFDASFTTFELLEQVAGSILGMGMGIDGVKFVETNRHLVIGGKHHMLRHVELSAFM
jgi:hypothetical protein